MPAFLKAGKVLSINRFLPEHAPIIDLTKSDYHIMFNKYFYIKNHMYTYAYEFICNFF